MFTALTNKLFEWVSGIEMHHCHECRLYRFGSWVQAAFVESERCGCYSHRQPEVKYIWICLPCREKLASFELEKRDGTGN